MIVNEDVVPSNKLFKKRLDRTVDAFYDAQAKQSEVEDQVAKMSKELSDKIYKFSYKLSPVPYTLGYSRKDLPLLTRLEPWLPIETYPFEKWEEDELATAIAVYPHIDKMIRDLKWIDNERKKIREVAKTAPAGEKYAYDKVKGSRSSGLGDCTRYIDTLLNVRKELNKHKEVLNK